MAHNLLQLIGHLKALNLNWCILCRSGETIDHLFFYCSVNLGLWCRIFHRLGWSRFSQVQYDGDFVQVFWGILLEEGL